MVAEDSFLIVRTLAPSSTRATDKDIWATQHGREMFVTVKWPATHNYDALSQLHIDIPLAIWTVGVIKDKYKVATLLNVFRTDKVLTTITIGLGKRSTTVDFIMPDYGKGGFMRKNAKLQINKSSVPDMQLNSRVDRKSRPAPPDTSYACPESHFQLLPSAGL